MPVIAFGVVPPIAGGADRSNDPPSVKLPDVVTVPLNVIPLTVPVPDTDVTLPVPTVTEPPRLIAEPLIVIALFVNPLFGMVVLIALAGMLIVVLLAAVS